MQTIKVNTSKPYEVHIGHGIIDRAAELLPKRYNRYAIITDDHVAPLYAERVKSALPDSTVFVFPHGENSKTLETVNKIYAFLSEIELSRNDCIIALGGGVTGDMAGFAAATYLRGVDYIQIPTSLLAQVDSSVGGKTAVDLPSGKNLVGAFHQPKAVIADIDTLDTLPAEYFADGLGEVLKYGMIRSKNILKTLENHDINSIKNAIGDIVFECINIKREIVENDEFEKGERKLLNFGHTFGHAIERLENFNGMSHGLAVVAGMKIVSQITQNEAVLNLLNEISDRYNLTREVRFSNLELLEAAMTDKKRKGDSIDIVVSTAPGESEVKNIKIADLRKICE